MNFRNSWLKRPAVQVGISPEKATRKGVCPIWVLNQKQEILPPKWMVYFMENPIEIHDLGDFPYFWKHPYLAKLRTIIFQELKIKGDRKAAQIIFCSCSWSHV